MGTARYQGARRELHCDARPAPGPTELVDGGGARAARALRPALPAAVRGPHRRRRDPGRRLHGDVERVLPHRARAGDRRRAARAGRVRRRAEWTKRRVRERLVERDRRDGAAVRRRRRHGALPRRRPERRGDRRVLRAPRDRRVVHSRRRAAGRLLPRAGGAVELGGRGVPAPRRRRRARRAHPRAGAGDLRLSGFRPGGVPSRVRDGPAGPAGPRAAARAPRAGCPDLRADAGPPVPPGPAGRRGDAPRIRSGGGGGRRRRLVGGPLAAVPAAPRRPGQLHRAHVSRARAPGRDRVDRRGGDPRPATVAPLPAHDARRADRVRVRGDAAGPGPTDRPAVRARPAVPCEGRSRPPPDVPELPRRADRGRMGRADRRRRHLPAVLRHARLGERPLRARVHRQRRRALPPRRADPREPRAARRRRVHASGRGAARAAALSAGAVPLAGDAPRERGHSPQGRCRGRRTLAGAARGLRRAHTAPDGVQPGTAMTSVTYGPMPRAARRSWWMEEALAQAELSGPPCPPLSGDLTADVVILGGGYTGMWSAYFLTERAPGIDVVLLEQDVCGGGPSGRNGGFVNGWWSGIGEMARRFGDADAMELCLAAGRSVEAIGAFCERHGVDAWFTPAGELQVASSPAQEERWGPTVSELRRLGVEDELVELTREEVRAICHSPVFRRGAFLREGATVQPARLARGLRRVLLERGVRIFESTPVRRFRPGPPAVAETLSGSVRAGEAILAVGSWGIHWRRFRPHLAVRGSYIVLTAPAPER